jgi:hypothetical protein
MDLVVGILVVFGIALVGALIFGGWATVALVRLILRAAGALFNPRPPALPAVPFVRCGHAMCRADNPGRARFCRRCGRMLQVNEPVVARKVAMW